MVKTAIDIPDDKFRPIPFIETIVPTTKKNDIARQNVKCLTEVLLLHTDR
jgi:hypothetical protein